MECWLASHAGIGFAGLQALVLMNCVNWDDFFLLLMSLVICTKED